ncbi:MAG: PEP-CTERM sorting domain-containing protein [Phycisphaerae bacterium]
MRITLLLMVALSLCALSTRARAAEWLGPNLVTNGDFPDSTGSGWTVSPGPWQFFPASFAQVRGQNDEWLRQSVSVEPGKRYRISGASQTWFNSSFGMGRSRTRISASGIAQTAWWNPIDTTIPWPGFTTQSAEGIAAGSSSVIENTWNILETSPVAVSAGRFQDINLVQVVRDPQLDITANLIQVNTSTAGGSFADISLELQSLSFADAPTSWSLDWGDSTIINDPVMNAPLNHGFTIETGDSQTWTALFSGINQAGSGLDTATIELLRQPDIALTIGGTVATGGTTLQWDIFANPTLDLSLLDSVGFIEEAAFSIPNRLSVIGTDLTFSGPVFDASDIGQIFPLTTTISNTGSGVNADQVSLNLEIVPEPATAFLLLTVGGLLFTRRRRSAR